MAINLIADTEDTIPEQDELVPGRERDEFQRDIDAIVAELKHETATAKWPAHDKTKLFRRLVVGQDDATALKKVIRRAATLHHVEPVFYKNGKTEKGHAVVKWHVARTEPRKDKDGKPIPDPTLNADGTPKGKIGADGKLVAK